MLSSSIHVRHVSFCNTCRSWRQKIDSGWSLRQQSLYVHCNKLERSACTELLEMSLVSVNYTLFASFRAIVKKVVNIVGYLGPIVIAAKRVVHTSLSRVSKEHQLVWEVENSCLSRQLQKLLNCSVNGGLMDKESKLVEVLLWSWHAHWCSCLFLELFIQLLCNDFRNRDCHVFDQKDGNIIIHWSLFMVIGFQVTRVPQMLDVSLLGDVLHQICTQKFVFAVVLVFRSYQRGLIYSIMQNNACGWIDFIQGRDTRARVPIRWQGIHTRSHCTNFWLEWAILTSIQLISVVCLAVIEVNWHRLLCQRHTYQQCIGLCTRKRKSRRGCYAFL